MVGNKTSPSFSGLPSHAPIYPAISTRPTRSGMAWHGGLPGILPWTWKLDM